MTPPSLEEDVSRVCDLVNTCAPGGARTIIGIAGPPASGKSTLAETVVQALNRENETSVPRAALLPMDGYHLDNRILEPRGLVARKGSPETFNAVGFCEAVKALSDMTREVFHPRFDRQMDLSIANAIAIHPDTPFVIVEGNYLLLSSDPWSALADVFSATVFVCPTMDKLRDRLRQRWINHGLDHDTATRRTEKNDLPNAELVIRQSRDADLMLHQNETEFGARHVC